MSETLDEIMWPNKYLLTAIGIWPLPPNASVAQKIFAYCRIALSLLCSCSMTWPLIYTIIVNWSNIDLLAGFGSLAIMFALSIFKVIYIIVRRRRCKRVYQHLKEFWDESRNREDKHIFEFFVKLAQKMTIVTYAYGLIEIFLFISSPIIIQMIKLQGSNETLRPQILPLRMLYGFDYNQSPTFEMLYFVQTFGGTVTVTALIGCDCTFMSAVIYLAGQFRLIRSRFKCLGQEIDRNGVGISMTQYSKEIGLCIAHHQRIIRITREISDLVSPVFFSQIATSGYVLCLRGYVISTNDLLSLEMFKFYILFACIIIQLVIWCWPGEMIIQESGAISRTIYYDIPWLNLPKNLQRDLNFVAFRAQQQCRIVAWFQIMSARKLTEVFNKAGSYMALLYSIRNQ